MARNGVRTAKIVATAHWRLATGDDPAHTGGHGATSLIRGLFRTTSFLMLAAGFVAAVMDGARTLANSALDYATLGATLAHLAGGALPDLQPTVERNLHPLIRDPVLVTLGAMPISIVLLVLGLVFHRIGRRGSPSIGHVTRN